jgi:formylglycine-generating enzyme required for sulfatase activity
MKRIASVFALCAAAAAWASGAVSKQAEPAAPPPSLTLELGDGVRWEGVLIPAGTFVMGSPPGEAKTEQESAMEKQHKVTLSQAFYIGKYETTQAQYQQVMGENPSAVQDKGLPVHGVSWQQAQDFCDRLTAKLGRLVQLPTEAQWEYAARAGTTTAYCSGNTIEDLDKVGWHGGNSGRRPHAVGEKQPNAWGVYDMHGNIREFVRDLWDEAPKSDAVDPEGPSTGDPKNHVVRGGAYTANAAVALNCRSAVRRPTETLTANGFRIVVPVSNGR